MSSIYAFNSEAFKLLTLCSFCQYGRSPSCSRASLTCLRDVPKGIPLRCINSASVSDGWRFPPIWFLASERRSVSANFLVILIVVYGI